MATAARGERNAVPARIRFVATIFIGSFLLFLVQPMIARMALPRLGGAPAVWNSAMIVYQALLLAGYAYAHALGRFAPRRQALVHLAVLILAALTLPIGLSDATPSATANPFLWVPWLLLVSIGPLFFVVSAQAPLIQRWSSLSSTKDPYPLYAASNFGSFFGLLAYPLLLEPMLPMGEQRWIWSAGYAALLCLVAWCANGVLRAAPAPKARAGLSTSIPWRTVAWWITLAAVPSGLILSTTLHLTTDVVAMPLLWVLPLGAYLLSFTVAFAGNRLPAKIITRAAPFVLLICIGLLPISKNGLPLFLAAVAVLNLFTVSVALHSELFERRPEPARLTLFYLAMSVGGLLGGIFCGLVAPLVFDWTYEHLLLLVAAAALMFVRSPFERFVKLWDGSATASRVTLILIAVLTGLTPAIHASLGPQVSLAATLFMVALAIFAVGNRILFAATAAALIITTVGWDRIALSLEPGRMTRSYFGVYTIEPGTRRSRDLVHGTTLHGVQNLGSDSMERSPTTYYAPRSGAGLALRAAPMLEGIDARIDVVGLGAGTLGCYARPGQSWTFYEIDPEVAAIATDSSKFTFLSKCVPQARIVIGDARLSLADAKAGGADFLVIDAFSSDSIPMHLLTREAFAVYQRRLTPNGLLLIHISNRHLDLEPVLAAAASDLGWQARVRVFRASPQDIAHNRLTSVWVALSPDPAKLDQLVRESGAEWRPVNTGRKILWTDDYGSLLPLIHWRS